MTDGRAARDGAVAIVGIGCRFPGGVRDVEGFWRLLSEGSDAIGEIPPSRIDLDHPVLSRDEGGPDALRVVAASGVYDEKTGSLALSGGVHVESAHGQFSTPATTYDTKSGNLLGDGVQGSAAFGQLRARQFSASANGKSVIYKGGVRARLNPK